MAKKTNKYVKPLTKPVDLGQVEADAHIERDMWWLLLLRGVLLFVFGMFAIMWPGITLFVLATMFGVYLLVEGFIDVIVGIRSVGHESGWFLKALFGVLEIVVGVYIINRGQLLTIATFILLLGVMLLFHGVVELVMAFKRSQDVGRRLWLILGALLSLAVGLIVLRQPVSGAIAFTWVLGFYGVFGGGVGVAAALSMRTPKPKAA